MKKAGFNAKKDDDKFVLIIIFAIVFVFIFGLKPLYQFFGQLTSGELFKKSNTIVEKDDNNSVKKDDAVAINPVGNKNLKCSKIIVNAGGEERIYSYLYYTDNKLLSINNKIEYSGITDEYSNYILASYSKYGQRKNNNISNNGYSIDVNLDGTSYLSISEIVLLEKTSVDNIISNDEELFIYGNYNDDIIDVISLYQNNEFICDSIGE